MINLDNGDLRKWIRENKRNVLLVFIIGYLIGTLNFMGWGFKLLYDMSLKKSIEGMFEYFISVSYGTISIVLGSIKNYFGRWY